MNEIAPGTSRASSEAGDVEAEGVRPSATRLWKVFTLLWIGPSAGALWILHEGPARYRRAADVRGVVSGIALEEWIAVGLIVLHLSFMFLWWRGTRREKRQRLVEDAEKAF